MKVSIPLERTEFYFFPDKVYRRRIKLLFSGIRWIWIKLGFCYTTNTPEREVMMGNMRYTMPGVQAFIRTII